MLGRTPALWQDPSMLFATGAVAGRLERAEARLAADFGALARQWRSDVLLAPIGGTTAVFAGPGEPFNKLAGLGFGAALDEKALANLEREYDERQAPLQVELASLADRTIGPMLSRRGYALENFENVLGLALTPASLAAAAEKVGAAAAAGVSVTRVETDQTPEWIDVVVTGFATPDTFDGPSSHESFPREALERVFGGLAHVDGFQRYLARREGTIAGGGSLRIFEGVAQLSGAATLPAQRRRGVQTTLLQARLLDAARSGCDLAVVTTQPGSKSQENVQRAGFELLYTRAIFVRPPRT
jgi:GNAT superfamily N-acetyltransferase